MKGRKIILLIIVLFTTFLKCLAPVTSQKYNKELDFFYQIHIDREERRQELKKFLDTLAYSESRSNPRAYNDYGYIGKYQFGYRTRKSCGYGYIRYWNFVRNPSIWSEAQQDSAMITLLLKNQGHLDSIINIYDGYQVSVWGRPFSPVPVTKSGILAAAHIAGAGGVKAYFARGHNPKDAYGTSLEDYLFRYSGFKF